MCSFFFFFKSLITLLLRELQELWVVEIGLRGLLFDHLSLHLSRLVFAKRHRISQLVQNVTHARRQRRLELLLLLHSTSLRLCFQCAVQLRDDVRGLLACLRFNEQVCEVTFPGGQSAVVATDRLSEG